MNGFEFARCGCLCVHVIVCMWEGSRHKGCHPSERPPTPTLHPLSSLWIIKPSFEEQLCYYLFTCLSLRLGMDLTSQGIFRDTLAVNETTEWGQVMHFHIWYCVCVWKISVLQVVYKNTWFIDKDFWTQIISCLQVIWNNVIHCSPTKQWQRPWLKTEFQTNLATRPDCGKETTSFVL